MSPLSRAANEPHATDAARRKTWDGGIIRYDGKGRPVFVIRKMVNGTRYVVSTRCHDEPAAMVHFRRFQADPEAYSPGGSVRGAPVFITDEVLLAFLTHSRDVDRNTPEWVHHQKEHLTWWKDRLAGVDLRRANLGRDILPALADAKTRAHRIRVLKRFYSWLISADRIAPNEDPTYRKLTAPKSVPKEIEPFPVKHFDKVRAKLAEPWRSLFVVQGGTGMHATELRRFAREGRIEKPNAGRTDGAAATLYVPKHKNGLPYRVAVSETVKRAAKVVLAHGTFDPRWFAKTVAAACRAARVPKITSRLMRHTVLTHAVTKGETVQRAGEFAGHSNVKTTRIYAQYAPPRIPTLA